MIKKQRNLLSMAVDVEINGMANKFREARQKHYFVSVCVL